MVPSVQPPGRHNPRSPIAVVAIGGNSLIRDPAHQDVAHQWDAVRETSVHIAEMIAHGWRVVITHGNGPQVGFILRRNELAAHELHTTPIDLIVADTQGSIGYMLQQSLQNELRRRGVTPCIVTLVTQVLVDASDPAFRSPTKPIGSFMDEPSAKKMRDEQGWDVAQDAGRGWRRVIASPEPVEIVEIDAITAATRQGWVVIAGGGGGIPVVRDPAGNLCGVAAVVDKDRLSALLATRIGADAFMISTSVRDVCLDYGTPNARPIPRMTARQATQYLREGQFAPGSMKPKIEAVLRFLEHGGRGACITDPPNLFRAVEGRAGTQVVPDEQPGDRSHE